MFLVAVTYSNALTGEPVSDDVGMFTENLAVTQGTDLFNFRTSLFAVVLRVIYVFFQANPVPYHLFNILAHLGCVLLVYFIIRRLKNAAVAVGAASLFAVHPILVEAVSWISGGSYMLYSIFLLGAFYLYLDEKRRASRYWLMLIFAWLALYTGNKAIIFPFIILLYEFALGDVRKNLKYIAGFGAIAAVFLILTIPTVGPRVAEITTGTVANKSFENPIMQFPFSISNYILLYLWPAKLTFYYSELYLPFTDWLWRAALTLAYLGLTVYMFFRNRFVFFWLAFFLVAMAPVLTPLRVAWLVAERYTYLGSVGIFAAVSYGAWWVGHRWHKQKVIYGILAVVVVALMVRSIIRNQDWQTPEKLWFATVKVSPSSPLVHYNLAGVYIERKQPELAIAEFQKAVKLNPLYFEAYHNMGNVYFSQGKGREALESYLKALEVNPQLWVSYQNMAAVYMAANRPDEALKAIDKAQQIAPNEPILYAYRGFIFLKIGKKDESRAAYEAALQLDPGNPYALSGLQELDK